MQRSIGLRRNWIRTEFREREPEGDFRLFLGDECIGCEENIEIQLFCVTIHIGCEGKGANYNATWKTQEETKCRYKGGDR